MLTSASEIKTVIVPFSTGFAAVQKDCSTCTSPSPFLMVIKYSLSGCRPLNVNSSPAITVSDSETPLPEMMA